MDLDLKKLLTIIWGKAWLVISAFVFGVILLYLYCSYMVTPLYTSSATLYVTNNNERKTATISSSDIMVAKELVNTCIVIIKSNSILDKVAEETNSDYNTEQIRRMISAGSVTETEVFSLNVTNPNPEDAQKIANAILKIAPNEIARVVKAGAIEVIDSASLPKEQSSPDVFKDSILGGIIMMVLAIAGIICIEIFDTRIKSESDLTNMFGLPIIGIVPSMEQEIQKFEKDMNS